MYMNMSMSMYMYISTLYVHVVHVCARVHAAAKLLIILLSPWAGPGLDFPEHVGTV